MLRGVIVGMGMLAALLVLCVLVFLFGGPRELHEVPSGYRGYLVQRYEQPSCPPLERRGLRRVFTYDESQVVCTSESRAAYGSIDARYEYVSSHGTRTPIPYHDYDEPGPRVRSHSSSADGKEEYVLVGTLSESERGVYVEPTYTR